LGWDDTAATIVDAGQDAMSAYPKPGPRKKASRDIPPAIRAALLERSGGLCEGCGLHPATEAHHRLYRSRGGKHTLANLVHLCGLGNHTGCHGLAHSGKAGEDFGWALRSGSDPAAVGLWYRGRWKFLADG
jgi:hypothetical protein